MKRMLGLVIVLSAGLLVAADQDNLPDPVSPDFDSPRPIAAVDSVFIKDLTWMEVRDAMRAGKKNVIVATGGIEQNGPYLIADKHNVVLRGTTEAIARKLGNTLVAPIVPFVPEGDINPPTSHMRYPTTISVSEETYERLVTDICESLRSHGFEHIILLGDSGDNQVGLKAVAERLNAQNDPERGRVHYIAEYYNFPEVAKYLEDHGVKQTPEGLHDDFGMTAMMMAVDPQSVRMDQRIAAGKFHINGVNLAPVQNTIEWGKRLIEFRADVAVEAIKKSIAAAEK